MVIDQFLAGAVLTVCVGLLLRLLVGAHRRQRFDAAVRRAWLAARQRALSLWHWRARRDAAAREAAEVIRRAARKAAERDGNVIRPNAFREPRKPH